MDCEKKVKKGVNASLFSQNKNSDFCAPLTSFDWNEVDPNLLGTSSIDTTCTIWGLEVLVQCTCIYIQSGFGYTVRFNFFCLHVLVLSNS